MGLLCGVLDVNATQHKTKYIETQLNKDKTTRKKLYFFIFFLLFFLIFIFKFKVEEKHSRARWVRVEGGGGVFANSQPPKSREGERKTNWLQMRRTFHLEWFTNRSNVRQIHDSFIIAGVKCPFLGMFCIKLS